MTIRRVRRASSAVLAVALALGIVGVGALPAQAVARTVTDEESLRAAMLAPDVDVIEFGGAPATINLSENLPPLSRDVQFIGNGWTIDGGGSYGGFVIAKATVSFTKITVTGMALDAIAMDHAKLTVKDSFIDKNPGAAVNLKSGSSSGEITIIGSAMRGNGSGVKTDFSPAKITVKGTLFRSNGFAIAATLTGDGAVTVSDSELENNNVGLLYSGNDKTVATVSDTTISSADSNILVGMAGAASLEVKRSTIYGAKFGLHTEFTTGGTLKVIDTTFTGHSRYGVYFDGGARADISFIGCTFSENADAAIVGQVAGPGIVIQNSLFKQNGHAGGDGDGFAVGIHVDNADTVIEGSTFSGNEGQDLWLDGMSTLAVATVENSTFSGIKGPSGGSPAEHSIQAYGKGQFNLRHATVTDSTVNSVVAVDGAMDATISHSIISGNTAKADLSVAGKASANVDWSIFGRISDTSAGAGYSAGAGVAVNVSDPKLAPLADNGGLTMTHLPLRGSPAIDSGNPSFTGAPTFDQRGFPRVAGVAIDIGAVEVAASVTPVAPTVSDPADVTVVSGTTATFAVTTTGTPVPAVTWQVSMDAGVSWQSITADTAATVATDGLSISVVTTDAHDGYLYRAIAVNSEGTVTSEPGELTVTAVVVPVAPTVSDPADVSVLSGVTATFAVTTTGSPVPSVSWEVSMDAGGSWHSITADTAASVATDGLSVSVVTTDAHDGYLYRAIAVNSEGTVTSEPAALTVTSAGSNPTPSDGPSLAATGSGLPLMAGLIGAIALLFGSGLVGAIVFARRRNLLLRD